MTSTPSHRLATGALLFMFVLMGGCNPFIEQKGQEGQACYTDGTCADSLHCIEDRCVTLPDCAVPDSYDCDLRGVTFQGEDLDQDGSGVCCDCDDQSANTYPGATEQCDGADNDCDGQTDEGDACPQCIDLDQDGYGTQCPAGDDCDDDAEQIHPGATELCDGIDQDCDGYTDELLAPIECPQQEGVCQGAQQICQGLSGWSDCDYGPDYSQEPELVCDLIDNDCDGQTDENVDRTVIEIGALATDNLDNNCNGLVDEPGGAMVEFPLYPGVWVDAYEMTAFENSDCTGQRYGALVDDYPAEWPVEGPATTELYACSLPNLVPSGHLSWHQAKRACEAQGKRLCKVLEYSAVCDSGQAWTYPYGVVFVPGICNDPIDGSGQAEPTGSRTQCTSGNGSYDMSGNLVEWLDEESTNIPGLYLTAGFGYTDQLCRNGSSCVHYTEYHRWEDVFYKGLRCVRLIEDTTRFAPQQNMAYLGARCCFDHP